MFRQKDHLQSWGGETYPSLKEDEEALNIQVNPFTHIVDVFQK